ncbi:unnamed protein product [Psylliodes chrysocephalus]|uniref:Uncharacterized protein n=1 Tax=Psylliodes chrysocephalus TaxID=3402493 RepID=A0A9P0CF26_9CUCU|nr:unnamed protein product [Psylliodes chrysocephala]
MPPIVVDSKTTNHNTLINDLKGLIKGEFRLKHTNYTTIIFVENKEDHASVLANIKNEKIAYHTYTARENKTHAFVLRGLAEGTKLSDIEENLEDEHDIKIKAIYQMRTKERPLFLVIMDLVMTLDYFNKNIRRVLYTRVQWELRKSTKPIIQCHNCQQWGHATANCDFEHSAIKNEIIKKPKLGHYTGHRQLTQTNMVNHIQTSLVKGCFYLLKNM